MTARTYLLSIDQGTTGSTVLIVGVGGNRHSGTSQNHQEVEVVGKKTCDFPQHFPAAGWVEHDLEEVWASVCSAAKGALQEAQQRDKDFSVAKIAALGITNQRETIGVFDRKSGRPLAKAIVWQCRRSTDICKRLKDQGIEAAIKSRTGLVLDPYFSGTKVTWMFENHPEIAAAIKNGSAVLGTIDAFLMHRLSGGAVFATDASNASRTLLYDINKGCWDSDLAEMLALPDLEKSLPEVRDSAGQFGVTKGLNFLPDGVPIGGVLGDQQAALAGQACFAAGEAKCTYGTGAFFLLNTGAAVKQSRNGMLSTVAWSLCGKRTYALEGSSFIAGAAMQFLRDQLGIIKSAEESEAIAAMASGSPEVYFVPALTGLGAPWWVPEARGAFLGLTRGTSKAQMIRAALEGVAFQVCDLILAMQADFGQAMSTLSVDGGAVKNNLLMQLQADFSGLQVDRPRNIETTAFGAALFAGLGTGVFKTLDEIKGLRVTDRLFVPHRAKQEDVEKIRLQMAGWQRAVKAVRAFAQSND